MTRHFIHNPSNMSICGPFFYIHIDILTKNRHEEALLSNFQGIKRV
jgi:hypothetical protein